MLNRALAGCRAIRAGLAAGGRRLTALRAILQAASRLAAPAVLLATAFLLIFLGERLPPSLAGLKTWGPYIVLVAGAALAITFERGRALLALLTLAAAYAAQQLWLQDGLAAPGARTVYLALSIFAPLNLALIAALPERGVFNRHGLTRLALIVAEVTLAAAAVAAGGAGFAEWSSQKFLPFPLGLGALPQAGLLVICLALAVTLAASLMTRSAMAASCAGSIVAFTVAAHVPTAAYTFSVFISAAGLMVLVAVLHDTYRMAFRDELTGLPGRRMLTERLAALPRRYAIAMIDIDHFKQFNDSWGHALGDHVLKMVGAQIAAVGGAGRAYRYGGEEFVVVFARKSAAEVLPHLEELRRKVESYQLALRAPERPPKASRRVRRPGGWKGKDSLSVSISIGVAERSPDAASPGAVIEAADRALYRAKEAGRNRVVR